MDRSAATNEQKQQQGFSLLELVIVICLIAVFMAIAYKKFEPIAEDAERASFYGVLGTLQTQLNLQVMDAYIDGRVIDSNTFRHHNPIKWLAKPPANYGGEVKFNRLAELDAGNWYYVKDQYLMAYKVKRLSGLVNKQTPNNLILFEIAVDYQQQGAESGVALAAILKSSKPFHWQVNDSE